MLPKFGRKVVFTPAGGERLEKARDEYSEKLEEIIIARNFVPGETEVEATASDVEAAVRMLIVAKRSKLRITEMVIRFYIMVGFLTAAAGLFYPRFEEIVKNSRQATLIFAGLGMVIAGMILTLVVKARYGFSEPPERFDREIEVDLIRADIRRRRERDLEKAVNSESVRLIDSTPPKG